MIIYFTDDGISLKRKLRRVQSQAKELGEEGINLLPVGIGPNIDIKELKDITKFNSKDLNVIHVGEYENPETVRKIIWHGKPICLLVIFIKRNLFCITRATRLICHGIHRNGLGRLENGRRDKGLQLSIAANDAFRVTCSLFISSNVPKLLSAVSLDCLSKRLTKIQHNTALCSLIV